jgi:hypothetical protein
MRMCIDFRIILTLGIPFNLTPIIRDISKHEAQYRRLKTFDHFKKCV